jgi:hypothetical protein
MPLTETRVIVLAEVHVQLLVITEVLYRTDPMAIHRQQLVLIPIEEILVMRCVLLPRAEVTDQIHRDLHRQQEVTEVLVTYEVLEIPEVQEVLVTYEVLEIPEVLEAQVA